MSIVLDCIERSRELFEESNLTNWIYFTNLYLLTISYLKVTKKDVDEKEIEKTLRALRFYFWVSLNEATEEIGEMDKEETVTHYATRIRNLYHSKRRGAYMFLQNSIKKAYSYVYNITQVTPEDSSLIRKNLITKKTLLVMGSDYEE